MQNPNIYTQKVHLSRKTQPFKKADVNAVLYAYIFHFFFKDTKVIYLWNKEKYRFQNIKKMSIIRFYFQNALEYYTFF